jgi:hypothetical protein
MAMRRLLIIATVFSITTGVAAPALACGGLVNPNGTVSLVKTTTLAAYKDGVEHYITNFEFAGGGAAFGSIVPLPGIPSEVTRAGDWTLQRLVKEITPVVQERSFLNASADSAGGAAEVILETRIDALDITVLKGGGDEVGEWAIDNGFALTPDTPEMLDFYAARSPIFMAARFDPAEAEARGQTIGDGTPIHLAIPTPNPWVPLRILTLGLGENAQVEADVFLLTENVPELLPRPVTPDFGSGMILERNEQASADLLADLSSDKGMEWLAGEDMWFSYLRIDTDAGNLRHDLAIDATGVGEPSLLAAGLVDPLQDELPGSAPGSVAPKVWAFIAGVIALWGAVAFRNRPRNRIWVA